MDISEWQDTPRARSVKKNADPLLSPAVIGLFGALLLHSVILESAYSEFLQDKNFRRKVPTSVQTTAATAKIGANLVLVEITRPRKSARISLDESFPKTVDKPDLSRLKVDTPPIPIIPLALDETEGMDNAGSTRDAAEMSRLSGIYSRQIQSRIERIWRRPRSPVTTDFGQARIDGGDSFQCEVQIVQDATGNVREVLLPRCNGTGAWQRSLVLAIQQASPLPAPPDKSVFLFSIVLKFIAFPYGEGSVDDDYELPKIQSTKYFD